MGGISISVASTSTLIKFPLQSFSTKPFLIVTHHVNNNESLRIDLLGYYVDTTGFKTNYLSGHTIDYFAIGY